MRRYSKEDKMDKVSIFDVMKVMGQRNLDIRAFNVFNNLKQVNRGKKHGTLTMMIDDETALRLLAKAMGDKTQKPILGMLLILDENQFNAIEDELKKKDL